MGMYISYIKQGDFNMVVSAQRDNTHLLPDAKTIEVQDSRLFSTILEALAERKIIKFYRNVDTLNTDNLEISDNSNLVKGSYLFQLSSEMSKIFTRIPQYNYFRFTYLNNVFASKGIFITEENREEKYIEILEMDDDKLIEMLEEYLKIMNDLNMYERTYQKFLNARESMEQTEEEVVLKQILDEALDFFSNAPKNWVDMDWKGWFSTVRGKYQEMRPAPKIQ